MDYFGLRPHQMGVGNVYYVIQSTHGEVDELTDYHEKTYVDGSSAVQGTIATALTASQAERNDYIVLRPDNDFYANSATLTMDKNDVHLIAPSNIGTGMANFRIVVQETGSAALLTVTGHGVEIAGLFLVGKAGETILDYGSGTVWSAFVHDSYFAMEGANGDTGNYGIHSTGALNSYCIRDNTFTNFSAVPTGDQNAIAAFIGITNNSSTRGLIKGNVLHTGTNTAVAKGILAVGIAPIIVENYLWEDVQLGSAEAGTFTIGIETSLDGLVANNVISQANNDNTFSGGTGDQSFVQNYNSEDGGTKTPTT